jgi:hypothetical protein
MVGMIIAVPAATVALQAFIKSPRLGEQPDGANVPLERLSHRLASVKPGARLAASLVSLGVVVFVGALVASWAQDAIAPWRNVGEAETGSPITFHAADTTYRVLASGPNHPKVDRIGCDINLSDGTTQRILGGEGSVAPNDRFGVSRVIEFEAPAGAPTTVRCEDRLSPRSTAGRMQVVDASGAMSSVALVGGLLGTALVLVGIGMPMLAARRASG